MCAYMYVCVCTYVRGLIIAYRKNKIYCRLICLPIFSTTAKICSKNYFLFNCNQITENPEILAFINLSKSINKTI